MQQPPSLGAPVGMGRIERRTRIRRVAASSIIGNREGLASSSVQHREEIPTGISTPTSAASASEIG
jgi:hypothetical protein